jgi:Fic family protein
MDKSKFAPNAPGRLVPISTRIGKDWSFVPAELPPRWTFDPCLWPLLVDAKEALGTLNGIGQTLDDHGLLLRPLQNREAISSSSIEGTYVTAQQLLLYELNPVETGKPNDQVEDWIEVHNYGQAIHTGREMMKGMPLCNRIIREMHRTLLHGVRGKEKAPGDFRKYQVQIGHNSRFMPPPASDVERLMSNLETYVNTANESFDPLVNCFVIHYQFEAIHPFLDGNGRIGRAVLALMIHKWLGHAMPWLYMSAFFEQFKDEYVDNLYKISTEGAWTKWIEFCLRGTIQQAKDAIRRCHEFNRLRRQFNSRVASPTPRTHNLIASLFIDPVLRISSLAAKTNVTYPTAKADIDVLVRADILKELPNNHPKTFYSPEIFHAAYGDDEEAF